MVRVFQHPAGGADRPRHPEDGGRILEAAGTAATQGAALPPFKDFKSSFRHMRATCAGVEVTPIHPFVLEHRVSEKNIIREGLYVFDPGAFGPQCATVTLSLYSEAQPERADTLAPTRTILDKIWNDFAPYRAIGP